MAASPSVNPSRRRQEDRSAETRGRLLSAAIECLIDKGYAGTTTTDIAQRAGVSRGAQLHHYPTKEHLLLAALEHVIDLRHQEFRRVFENLPHGTDRIAAAVDLLWQMVSGPTGQAWLELTLAARTDAVLRDKFKELTDRFRQRVYATFQEFFPELAATPLGDAAPAMTFAVLDGLAVNEITASDPDEVRRVLDALKLIGSLQSALVRS